MAQKIAHDALAMTEYLTIPSVLVLADSDVGAARARRSAERAGCRISDAVGIEEALERLDWQVAVDAVMVEIEHDHGDALDRLLDRLNADGQAGRHGSVISAPPGLIDIVAARIPHARVQQLCGASEIERVTAVALAAARRPARLHDVRRAEAPGQLQQLSEEVGRIANILASLSEDTVAAAPKPKNGEADGEPGAAAIRAIIRARRLRDHYFKAEFFADPAWDMLLDLMAARQEKKGVAVSSLCIAAAVPPTTALRWIKTLTDHGLLVRSADPRDGRRVYIELSDEAAAGLSAYFKALQRISPLAI